MAPMKFRKKNTPLPVVTVVFLVLTSMCAGCGAIRFFPRQLAEKAADKVLDDILQVPAPVEGGIKPTLKQP